MSTQQEKILSYIRKQTEQLLKDDKIENNGVEASDITYTLGIDRANVSRYLNALWKNGSLIKVSGRPVFYLDYQTISNAYPDVFVPSFVPANYSIKDYFKRDSEYVSPFDNNLDLNKMLGADGSLAQIIAKAKAAVSYPPYGLNTLISGNSGTEKSTLAESMIVYAIESNIKNKNCPYFDIDCRRANVNISQFEERLFGYVDNDKDRQEKGLFEKCAGGFLIMENIDFLPQSTLELISSVLNKGYFTKVNSSKQIPLKCMLILLGSTAFDDPKLKPISHYTAINIHLPDLENRGTYEKLEAIMDCFAVEARNIKAPIRVSKDVIVCLCLKEYKENLTQLENNIKDVCAHAYLNTINNHSGLVDVSLGDLPADIYELTQNDASKKSNFAASRLLSIIDSDYLFFDKNGNSSEYNYYKQYPSQAANEIVTLLEQSETFDNLEDIEDSINKQIELVNNCNAIQLKEIRNKINPDVYNAFSQVLLSNSKYSSVKDKEALFYAALIRISNTFETDLSQNDIKKPLSKDRYPEEYSDAKTMYAEIEKIKMYNISNREIDYLAVYLNVIEEYLNNSKVSFLVISHGENIATEMVEFIKTNIDKDASIDAIDFNDDMQINDCLELACIKAKQLNKGAGVLAIVDKEPFTTISDYISAHTGISSKTVYPLTLNGLIQIVEKNTNRQNGLNELYIGSDMHTYYVKDSKNEFIQNLIEKLIYKNCTFIDAYKATDTLVQCLNYTLNKLNITYSNEIATKYLCHCVNMLERVIKNEAWDKKELNRFNASNHQLMQAVSQGLQLANNMYGITIPQTELVYVAQIFVPYIKEGE